MLAEHQIEAAERALQLLRTRGGVVLADDPGLGKSFVAAEVMRRFEGTCELIVPASLVAQWRETLAQFGVEARIFTHDSVDDARASSGLRPPSPRTRGEGRHAAGEGPCERRLVVVDEAHAFRNPRTQRYAALARRTAAARVLLVTATPVCNGAGDLEALLRLIARDDLLADLGVPSIDAAFESRDFDTIERVVAALVIRRDRSVLPESLQFGELERRVIRHPVVDAPVIDTLEFPLIGDHAILRRFLRRRLESSEAALLESVRRQLRFYERALSAIAAGRTLPKREYRRAFAFEEDQPAFQDVLFWELFAPPGDADPNEIKEEMRKLESLRELARAAPNTKRAMLLEVLDETPTLIFTGSVATARDLASTLKCGLVTSRDRSRDATLKAFVDGRIDIVVSTDLAAEGLNLQRAGTVIHYDIPWNPVKLDQRNGRAHRIGQTREQVRAIYFIPQSRETRIVETIARKNRVRRRVLKAGQLEHVQPTLRPRFTRHAAASKLRDVPELLARRHKAGIELLMQELPLDQLITLVACQA